MKTAMLLVAVLGAGSAAAATTLLTSAPRAPQVTFSSGDWDDEHPGPDSSRVAQLLEGMGRADPVACEMLSAQVGNGWWNSGDELGVGRLADARVEADAARDSISGQVRDQGAIRLLTARLADDDPCVRHTAARMLGHSVTPDQDLAALLDGSSARVREAALLAIGSHDRPALRQRVEEQLRSPDVPTAAMAAWALGELEDRESVGALERVLEHDAAAVRTAAAWALGQVESVDAAPSLERMAEHDDNRLARLAAVEALGEIEAARSAPVLARVVGGKDERLAVAAAEAIGNLDDLETAPPELLRAVASGGPPLRHAAVEALASIEDPASAGALLPLITDPDADTRRMVIEALGNMGAVQAKAPITAALEDRNPDVRRTAVEALAELEDDD